MATAMSFPRFMNLLNEALGNGIAVNEGLTLKYDNKAGVIMMDYLQRLHKLLSDDIKGEKLKLFLYYSAQLTLIPVPKVGTMLLTPAGQSVTFTEVAATMAISDPVKSVGDQKVIDQRTNKIPLSFYQKLGLAGACQIANKIDGNINFYNLYCDSSLPKWFCSPLLAMLPWKDEFVSSVDRALAKFDLACHEKWISAKNQGKVVRPWRSVSAKQAKSVDSKLLGSLFRDHVLIGSMLKVTDKTPIQSDNGQWQSNPAYEAKGPEKPSGPQSINISALTTQRLGDLSSGVSQQTAPRPPSRPAADIP